MMSKNSVFKLSVVALFCASAMPVMAAKPVDLSKQSMGYLKSVPASKQSITSPTAAASASVGFEEISQSTDKNQTVHTRIQQTYSGFPVWGGDAIIHTPNGRGKNLRTMMSTTAADQSTMNGVVYEDLQKDLLNTPAFVFTPEQAKKAFTHAIADFESRVGAKAVIRRQKNELMVYVDENNQAHWAFFISATVRANNHTVKPTYIMDAADLHVYEYWDDRKTATADDVTANPSTSTINEVKGGGFGGNQRTGKLSYDGLSLASLIVNRNDAAQSCTLENNLAKVVDGRTDKIVSFPCAQPNNQHGSVYWNEGADAINGGFSPNNDALFASKIITSMYQDWYDLPVLTKDGKPMLMTLMAHDQEDPENASWSDEEEIMRFGDGGDTFYPMTSLGVTAHEISHGFTSQHSNLIYKGQSGGMNESFSDMADQAAKVYATNNNDWMIGSEIAKEDNFALRYLDKPSKDCKFGVPGILCSIDNANQYHFGLNVHFSSGVFNHAFYFLATTPGWNVHKAFDVMVQANRNYWTANSTFEQGACGVISAAKDYNYDTQAVINAFSKVKVKTNACS